jgi:hypothetical protein
VEHVHLGTEEEAKDKLEELALAHFKRGGYEFNGTWGDCGSLQHLGSTPYERYRRTLYWHIHNVGVST